MRAFMGAALGAYLAIFGCVQVVGAQSTASAPSPVQIQHIFAQGMSALEAGDARRAVGLFRAILANDPNLPRVRLELARALFLLGQWNQSREEFLYVLSGDVPTPVKLNILRFVNLIDARRGFDWSASVGVATGPESGRSYDSDMVDLDFFGNILPFQVERAETETIGLSFEGTAEFRRKLFSLGKTASTVGFVRGQANLFDANHRSSDDFRISLSAGTRFIWQQTTAIFSAIATAREIAGDLYETRQGLSLSLEHRTKSGFIPFINLGISEIDNHNGRQMDGELMTLGLGFTQSLFGNTRIGASLAFETYEAEASYESYDGWTLALIAQSDLGHGINATAKLSYGEDDYDSRTPLFLTTRADRQYSAELEVLKNDLLLLDHFFPFAKVGYTRNDSEIGIYSYDEYKILLGLRNAF